VVGAAVGRSRVTHAPLGISCRGKHTERRANDATAAWARTAAAGGAGCGADSHRFAWSGWHRGSAGRGVKGVFSALKNPPEPLLTSFRAVLIVECGGHPPGLPSSWSTPLTPWPCGPQAGTRPPAPRRRRRARRRRSRPSWSGFVCSSPRR
jgi:hypothetical protein